MRGPKINAEVKEFLEGSTSTVASSILENEAHSEKPQITASQLPRLFKCNGSLFLPNENNTSEAAERGTEIHKYLEWFVNDLRGKKTDKPKLSEETEKFCETIDTQEIRALIKDAGAVMTEQVFGAHIGVNTPHRINGLRRDKREYFFAQQRLGQEYFVGTCDLVVIGKNGTTLSVYDFKTGVTDYGDPTQSAQLLAAAVALEANANIGFIYIRNDGSVHIAEKQIDESALNWFNNNIILLRESIVKERPKYNTGDHCKYCPSFKYCPKQSETFSEVNTMVSGGKPVDLLNPTTLAITKDNAAAVLNKLEQAEMVFKFVRGQLEAFAEKTPFVTMDGATFGPKETTRESIDADIARKALAAEYGQEIAAGACEIKMTKTSLSEVLGEYAKVSGLKKAEVIRGAMELLREAGAVKVSTSTSVGRIK